MDPQSVAATWRNRAQTSLRALWPSGKDPIAFVRRLISRLTRSVVLLLRIRFSWQPQLASIPEASQQPVQPFHGLRLYFPENGLPSTSCSIEVIFWIPSALTFSTFVINFSRDIFVLPPLKIWIAYLYFTAGGFFLFSRNPEPQFV